MATISTSAAISGTKSPGGTMLTIGTLIMMRVPVSVDRAVAAWPAPMFATSRSASSRALLISVVPPSVDCASRRIVISEESGGVDYEGGSTIAKNGGTAKESSAAVHAVELLHDDFLLPDEFIDDERGAAVRKLDQDDLPACLVRRVETDSVAEPDRGKHVVADSDNFLSLDLLQHGLRQRECLEHVGEWDRVDFLVYSGNERAGDRQGEWQTHAHTRAEPR